MRVLFLCLLLCFSQLAIANDFQTAVIAYNQGNYNSSFPIFKKLAEQDHIDAQNNLGVAYQTGRGVAQDYQKAAQWYGKAAERGHAAAQNNLGLLYYNGQGVERDPLLAYAWFDQAAQQGIDNAKRNRDLLAQGLSAEQIQQTRQLSLNAPKAVQPVVQQNVVQQNAQKPADAQQKEAIKTAAVMQPKPKEAVINKSSPASSKNSGKNYYGPVAAGETLWSIANKLKPAGITTQQMLLAIQKINPQAFSSSSINSLKAKAKLKVPSTQQAKAVSAEQARILLKDQL